MPAPISSDQVWGALRKQLFAVLGLVTARGEPRTVGIVYVVRDRQLYVATERASWKVRHVEQQPKLSVTVPIEKRVPFMPWLRIPAATVSFQGEATLHAVHELPAEIQHALLRGVELDRDAISRLCVIAIRPTGEFLTYGVGVSLMAMRVPEKSRGRAPV